MTTLGAKEASHWVSALLQHHGTSRQGAEAVARNLVWNGLVGRHNFTFGRLPIHIERLKAGVLNPKAAPKGQKLGPATGKVDGENGFGHYAGEVGMALSIDLARQSGAGVCVVEGSNFFGTGAYFVNMAAEAGMAGLALSNSYPKVAAHNGSLPVLGTNPMAFGAPRENGAHFLLDMATSGLAGSSVRQHMDEGRALPEGLAVARDGTPITDPAKVAEGALLPFGGAKGFGLSMMVEILAGVLSGAGISQEVGSLYADFDRPGRSGHFFLAIDIARFMPLESFFARFEQMLAMVAGSAPQGGVVYPGQVRWREYERNSLHGIPISKEHGQIIARLGAAAGLGLPKGLAV